MIYILGHALRDPNECDAGSIFVKQMNIGILDLRISIQTIIPYYCLNIMIKIYFYQFKLLYHDIIALYLKIFTCTFY